MWWHFYSNIKHKNAFKTVRDRSDFPMVRTIRFSFHGALKKENDSPFTFLVCFACRTWSSYINNNIFPPQFLWSWHCILFCKISLTMLVKNKYLLRVHSCIFVVIIFILCDILLIYSRNSLPHNVKNLIWKQCFILSCRKYREENLLEEKW